jgi:hypothetical protein
VTNELATTAPGPYTLRFYTDNATIGLVATQGNAQASYRYNWLAACSGSQPAPNRAPVAQPIPDQGLVVGQLYQLELSGYFTDPDGQGLTFTSTGLPAGLSLSGSRISGSPTQTGSTTVQVTALDPGGLQVVGSVLLRVDAAPVTPTPGVFSIAGVTGVRCETLSAGERQLSFSPVYTGLTGAPISFGIINELATTIAPGPYSLRLYTDNSVITLTATQGGTPASYRFSWLAGCAPSANGRQAVGEAVSPLTVVVLGNPVVGESVEVIISGVAGQPVTLRLRDLAGQLLHQQQVVVTSGSARVVVPVSTRQAMTLLQVSTATQHQTIKLIRQ